MNKAFLISPLLFLACTPASEMTTTIDISSAAEKEITSTSHPTASALPMTEQENTSIVKQQSMEQQAMPKEENPATSTLSVESESVVNVEKEKKSAKEEKRVSKRSPQKAKKAKPEAKKSPQKTIDKSQDKKADVVKETEQKVVEVEKKVVEVEQKKESTNVELSPLQQHLKNIETQYSNIQSLEANFVQVVTRAEFPDGVEQSGRLSVLQPSYFRWDIEFPMEQSY